MWDKSTQQYKCGLVRRGEFIMKRSEQITNRIGGLYLWMTVAVTALATLSIVAAAQAHAQTFTVIHSFSGPDGGNPVAGVTLDQAGNLYGTTQFGGSYNCEIGGCGTVFKLTHRGSGWVLSQLYVFAGGDDSQYPAAKLSFGPDGALYGSSEGGIVGTVFSLRPPASICRSISCPWIKTVVFSFGESGPSGDLTFDAAGNIYGTTANGGMFQNCGGLGCGVVYELTLSGGVWTEDILHNFTDGVDGGHPHSGVLFDHAGNLYGTASIDNFEDSSGGVVFELTPSGSGWTQTVLYRFQNSAAGSGPYGGLIFDAAGNLYGTTAYGGSGDGGTVFELSPSGDNWNFNLLSSLTGLPGGYLGPYGKLVQDSVGNLYGTSVSGGANNYGYVFKLTPSNGGWTLTDLHDFTNGSDGAWPYDGLVIDANGNLYGTAFVGGNPGEGCYYGFNCGVVFEITP
jgi:uncharacterized repeat protein (TIGR03803 family)